MPLISELQRQADLYEFEASLVHSEREIQDSQGYSEKPCLAETKTNKHKPIQKTKNTPPKKTFLKKKHENDGHIKKEAQE